jgi:hypothetical protein
MSMQGCSCGRATKISTSGGEQELSCAKPISRPGTSVFSLGAPSSTSFSGEVPVPREQNVGSFEHHDVEKGPGFAFGRSSYL